jgi:predicted phosphate transport protein (TIGR00153 family)
MYNIQKGIYMSASRVFTGGRLLEEINSKLREHLDHITRGVEVLDDILKNYNSLSYEDMREKYEELNTHEEESDKLKRDLMSLLRASHLHPEDREDLLRTVLTVDDVIGLAKAVVKKILIFKHLQLEIPRNLHNILVNAVEKSLEAVRLINNILEIAMSDYERVLELTHKIEELEEEVDEIRLRAFEELLRECSTNIREICVVMPVVIDDIEKITDMCEDVADLFRLHLISR